MRQVPAPIAVIGMACRFPGAPDPEAFWRFLLAGSNAIGDAIADRWPDASFLAESAGRHGAFLENIEMFDADFFGISPAEAAAMDPQQRLALELAWEALEDAGIVPARLSGSPTGVFVGATYDDYAALTLMHGSAAIGRYTMTGSSRAVIANRISYQFGFGGPSLAVDSAQSSSAVAVHAACESLRASECTLALAGGVNLNIIPQRAFSAGQFGALSPDGECFVFEIGRASCRERVFLSV